MRELTVINKKGLAACIAAAGKDVTRRNITCVLIEPNGDCVGTDGHRMVISKQCFEPFDGEKVMMVIDKLSTTHINLAGVSTLFIDGKESRLSLHGKKRALIPCTLIENQQYPLYNDVMAEPCDNMNAICFDINKIADIEKIINQGLPMGGMRFSQKGVDNRAPVCVEFDGCKQTMATLMPIKQLR